MRVLIAGGGIAGLATAACLLKAGHTVKIFEKARRLAEVGAGIQLSPNAARVLQRIGAYDAALATAARPQAYRFRLFDSGEVLHQIPFGAAFEARHGLPYLTVHRADLLAALVGAVEALDPDAIELGAAVDGYVDDGHGVTVHLAGRTMTGDILVGADGVRSVVRDTLLGPTPARYTGQAAWRIAVPATAIAPEPAPTSVDIWVGPGRHAVTYPLRGGSMVNMVAAVAKDSWEDDGWTTARPWQELKADFPGWHPFIHRMIDAANRDECYRWALFDRDPVDRWANGRVVILGDAAHPTLPYMAQGAAMALEDAAVFARVLSIGASPVDALHSFAASRTARTAKVVLESRANAKLFQMQSVVELRENFSARDISGERNMWLFSYNPWTARLHDGA